MSTFFGAISNSDSLASFFLGLETPKPAKKKHLEFPEVNVAGGNQDKATSLPSGVLAICFLYYMAFRTEWNKKTGRARFCWLSGCGKTMKIGFEDCKSFIIIIIIQFCTAPLSIPGLFWMATEIEWTSDDVLLLAGTTWFSFPLMELPSVFFPAVRGLNWKLSDVCKGFWW